MSGLEIIELEARWAAVVRRLVPLARMPQAQREARTALQAGLGEAARTGRRLTLWKPPHGGMIDYAPGVLVAGPIDVSGEVSLVTLPAGRAAHLRLEGGYDGLPQAWHRLFEGCAARDLRTAGLNWEIYAPDPGPHEGEAELYALLA